ncbi:hypothetical protein [Brevifollis gellanilyticus]|uniref:Uncharacterized protein n=1 Tax=Brevifollis gellanilyticus TaxID=748831 RepID=A0A512M8H9_9BACT|nr:hypothetical protein [Brevifollis gellanilyticus]GEP43050.1 hypothetical protein BGE01nite_23410 [Brevifollis gellanilyticus]
MDGKIFAYGLCLLAIIVGTSFWTYTMDIDEAHKNVELARQQLSAVEDGIKHGQAWIVARKEASAQISAAGIIEQQNQKLRDEIAVLKQQRVDVAKVFLGSIERARGDLLGRVMAEVTLATGTTLKQASIQSIDPEITVFQHSEGVSKVPTTILPSTLLDRLRFGYQPEGVAISPSVVESTSSSGSSGNTIYSRPTATRIDTSASDSLTRLGMNSTILTNDQKKKKALPPPRDPNRIKVEGDPALWKNVERTSIGRAYIPGQGWLKVGADGPIPGSARSP